MRKDMTVKLSTFIKALQNLGYRKVAELEFRRHSFHIILIQKRRNRLTVHLHVDVPLYASLTKLHRSRQHGKDLTEEWKRIKKEYKKLRAEKSNP